MSIEGQGHFFTIYFPGYVCFVLYKAKLSGERLQDLGPLVLNLSTWLCLIMCSSISQFSFFHNQIESSVLMKTLGAFMVLLMQRM